MSQQSGKARRCAEKRARLGTALCPGEPTKRRLRGRPFGHQQYGRTDPQRKGERISKTIRKEQLCGRKAHIRFGQTQDRLAVQLNGPVGIGVRMHGTLGPSGRS